jgi:hypothetical protein
MAYLLILWSGLNDIIHEYWKQFGHSIDASRECTIGSGATSRLASLASLFYPSSSYRVYNVEYAQFVCSRSFLEVCVDLLDEDGFGLFKE